MPTIYIIKDCGHCQSLFGATESKEEAVRVWRAALRNWPFARGFYACIEAYETVGGEFKGEPTTYNCAYSGHEGLDKMRPLLPLEPADMEALQYNYQTPTPPQSPLSDLQHTYHSSSDDD